MCDTTISSSAWVRCDEIAHLCGHGARRADERHARASDRIGGIRRVALPLLRRRRQLDRAAGPQAGERLTSRRRQESGLVVGVRGDHVDPQHDVRGRKLRRWREALPIDADRVEEHGGREVRGEHERQAQGRGDLRAERAGAEDPDGHPQAGAGHRLHGLTGLRVGQELHHLEHVVGEVVGIDVQRAPKRDRGGPVRAGGTTQTQIDATGKQRLQRAELFGDLQGRVVRQHDAAGPDPDARCTGPHVTDQHRRGRAADAGHVVVLGQPEAVVAAAAPRAGPTAACGGRPGRPCRPGRWGTDRGPRGEPFPSGYTRILARQPRLGVVPSSDSHGRLAAFLRQESEEDGRVHPRGATAAHRSRWQTPLRPKSAAAS